MRINVDTDLASVDIKKAIEKFVDSVPPVDMFLDIRQYSDTDELIAGERPIIVIDYGEGYTSSQQFFDKYYVMKDKEKFKVWSIEGEEFIWHGKSIKNFITWLLQAEKRIIIHCAEQARARQKAFNKVIEPAEEAYKKALKKRKSKKDVMEKYKSSEVKSNIAGVEIV